MYDVSMFAMFSSEFEDWLRDGTSHHRLFRVRVMHDASNFPRAHDVASCDDHANVNATHLHKYNVSP